MNCFLFHVTVVTKLQFHLMINYYLYIYAY